ncbi:MAG: hypothetical protein QOC92_1098 [Acidimicrobiaceae bacterium]|jgi:uncharacterized protein (TIGR03083 family)
MEIWGEITASRLELADYLDTLDDKAWETQSLCEKWTVRQLAGHLIMPLTTPIPRIMLSMVGTGFNFDKANDKLSRKLAAQKSPQELIATLRANADSKFKPPGSGPEAPLSDVAIHSSDIRRPLGAPPVIPGNRAEAILDFLTKAGRGFVAKGRIAGLRFEATDLDWNSGNDGQVVRGPAEALILAISGRNVALDDLEGEGVTTLRSRS